MTEHRRKFSPQFRAEAVQMAISVGKPIAGDRSGAGGMMRPEQLGECLAAEGELQNLLDVCPAGRATIVL